MKTNLVQLRSKFFEIAHLNKSLETVNLSEFDKEKLAKLKLQTLTIEMQEELDSNAITIDQMSQVQLKSKLIMDAQKNQMMNVMYADSLKNERLKLKDLTILEANSKRNFFATAFVFILFILAISLFLYLKLKKTSKLLEEKNKLIKEKNKLIEIESEKSESLLLNILPSNIVQELKEYGHSKAKNHEAVCVGFLDLVSFTKISAKTNPQTVLDNLNFCFKAFDDIIAKHKLEKIKTIGDCYMYAGGLSESKEGNTINKMILASKEMVAFLAEWNTKRTVKTLPPYDARIGIHSGPVAAGVVGTKKFHYDIWGDTVNIAARLEQNSHPNKINISEVVYQSVKKKHLCEYRGEIEAKNKGKLKMYFVN